MLKASMLNLFNRVVHFDDASGFDGYIERVEMYYKSIPSGLIAARMTCLVASPTDTALYQLNHVINDTFPVLENLNRLTGILRCNRCIQRLIINCKMG